MIHVAVADFTHLALMLKEAPIPVGARWKCSSLLHLIDQGLTCGPRSTHFVRSAPKNPLLILRVVHS